MRKLPEVLSEDEMEDLQESLMDVLRKAKTNAKKRNINNPPVNITNLLTSPTTQNGYIQYLQALAQHPTLRGHSHISLHPRSHIVFCSHLRSMTMQEVISDIDTEEQK